MLWDINLLPKKERKLSMGAMTGIIVTGTVYIMAMAYFGFIMPSDKKNDLEHKINKLQDDINSYNANETEFYQLTNIVNMKSYEGEALLALRNSRLDITELLDNMEVNMPVDIYLDQVNIAGGLLDIQGYSKNYQDIAKFIVKLRTVDKVYNTTFTTATLKKEDEKESYSFSVYSNLEQRDIIAELQSEVPIVQIVEGGTTSR